MGRRKKIILTETHVHRLLVMAEHFERGKLYANYFYMHDDIPCVALNDHCYRDYYYMEGQVPYTLIDDRIIFLYFFKELPHLFPHE